MRIFVERAKTLDVGYPWLYFCLRNPDIMNGLSKGPLSVSCEGDDVYIGSIFGVAIRLEVLGTVDPEPEGEVDIVSDVLMPLGLGRTYTVAHWRYRALDNSSSLAELSFVLETHGLAMALYAQFKKRSIDSYLENLMLHTERAARALMDHSAQIEGLLTMDQLDRVAEYEKIVSAGVIAATKTVSEQAQTNPAGDDRPWLGELTELTSLYQKYEGQADEVEEELIRIRDTRDSVATLLVARRMLELIVVKLCESKLNRKRGTEPLASVIDKLGREGCVPEYIITSMNNLNRLSLFGAHPKKFSPRQVREALMALCSVVEWHVK